MHLHLLVWLDCSWASPLFRILIPFPVFPWLMYAPMPTYQQSLQARTSCSEPAWPQAKQRQSKGQGAVACNWCRDGIGSVSICMVTWDRRSGRCQSFCWIHVGAWVNRMQLPGNVGWGKDCFILDLMAPTNNAGCHLLIPAANLQQHINGLPVAERQSSV